MAEPTQVSGEDREADDFAARVKTPVLDYASKRAKFDVGVWLFWIAGVVALLAMTAILLVGTLGTAFFAYQEWQDPRRAAFDVLAFLIATVFAAGLVLLALFFWRIRPQGVRNLARLDTSPPMGCTGKHMARRVFISVGEASGDQHAAHLIRELRAADPELIIEGIGGAKMAEAGAFIHRDTVTRAAMGWEAALRYIELRRVLDWTREYFRDHRPDLQICIDSWSMNWHWARLARQNEIPVLYYVAPQMWASRQGRVKKLKKYVDRVACILPFEEKFYRDRGVDATFVGHPLFDALQADSPDDSARRFPNRPPVIGLVPGSRASVVRKNFRNLLEVAARIRRAFPQATFMVPTMPATHAIVEELIRQSDPSAVTQTIDGSTQTAGPFTLGMSRFDSIVRQCDLCLTVSGTATLHVAANGAPMIVVYRVNRFIWHLFARWVIRTRTYSLVNLLSDTRKTIVPEFIPWYGSNIPVAEKALEYLHNPQMLEEQRSELRQVIRGLNKPGASRNAAALALDLMTAREKTQIPPIR